MPFNVDGFEDRLDREKKKKGSSRFNLSSFDKEYSPTQTQTPSQQATQQNKVVMNDVQEQPKEQKSFFQKVKEVWSGIGGFIKRIPELSQEDTSVDVSGKKRVERNLYQEKVGELTAKPITESESVRLMKEDPIGYALNRPFYSSDGKLMQQQKDVPVMDVITNKIKLYNDYTKGLTPEQQKRFINPYKNVSDDVFAYVSLNTSNIRLNTAQERKEVEAKLNSSVDSKEKGYLKVQYDALLEQEKNLEMIERGVKKNEGFFKGFFDSLDVPVLGTIKDANEARKMMNALRKLESGEQLNSEDNAQLAKAKNINYSELVKERGLGYELGSGLSGSLVLMAEMMIALAIPTGVDEVAVGSNKALSWTAQTLLKAGQITATTKLPAVFESTYENMTPDYNYDWKDDSFDIVSSGDDSGKAILKGVASVYGNTAIELGLGDVLDVTVKPVKSLLVQNMGKSASTQELGVVKSFLKEKGGLNGFMGEFAEEIAQKYYEEGVIQGKEFVGTKEVQDDKKQFSFTPEELAKIGASVLLIQAVMATPDAVIGKGRKESSIADIEEQIRTTIQDSVDNDQPSLTSPERDNIDDGGLTGGFTSSFEGVDEIVDQPVDQVQSEGLQEVVLDNVTKDEEDTALQEKINQAIESKLAIEDLSSEEMTNVSGMFNELQEAILSPKKRYSSMNEDTGERTYGVEGAGYPSWIPEEYRSKPVVSQVIDAFIDSTTPKTGSKAYELYQLVLQNSRDGDNFLGYTTSRRRGERGYGDIESMDDIRRNLSILRNDRVAKESKVLQEAKGWLTLSDGDVQNLNHYDKSDYENYLLPQLEAIAVDGVGDGEVVVIKSGKGSWVDTDIKKALNRGVNKDTIVMVVKENEIKSTGNNVKDEGGERLLNEGVMFLKEDGSEVKENISRQDIIQKEDGAKQKVNLESYDDRGIKVDAKEVRIASEVVQLVRKYASKVGEKYLPKGALGAFFTDTKDIRLKGMTEFYVASHEIAHAIDQKAQISLFVENDATRQELMEAYVDIYPSAKKQDDEKLKLTEGFASLVAEYIKSPSTMAQRYPHAVKELFLKDGKYFKPIMGDYLQDLTDIVIKYQSLNDLDKIGSRLARDIPTVPNTLFKNKFEEFLTVNYDSMRMLERVVKESGEFMRKDDFVQGMRMVNYSGSIIENNFATTEVDKVKGKKELKERGRIGQLFGGILNFVGGKNTDEYWRFNPETGNVDKLLDYNWGTLRTRVAIKGLSDQFNYALVARRSYYDFVNKEAYEKELSELQANLEVVNNDLIELDQSNKGELTSEMKEKRNEKEAVETRIAELDESIAYTDKVIKNDDFDRDLITRAYFNSQDLLASEYQMFDELTNQDLLLAKDAGKLSEDKYKELKDNKGYAPFKRIVYDEVIGEVDPVEMKGVAKLSGTQISSLKKRTGSTKEILYPLDSAMRNHQEFVKKSMRQIALNKFLTQRTVATLGEFMKPVEYTQGLETKPEILIKMTNGEKKAYAVHPMIKAMIGDLLPHQSNAVEKFVHQYKKMVTSSITGSYMQFALTNLPRDFVTYSTQTFQSNNVKAVYNLFADTFKVIGGNLKNNEEFNYFNKFLALGGQEMTFVKWMEGDYKSFDKNITNDKHPIQAGLERIGKGLLDIVSLPSHVSELIFRATEFIEAKKVGDSDVIALEKAKRVTTPFHFKGTYQSVGKDGQVRETIPQAIIKNVDTYAPFVKAGKNAFAWTTLNFIENPKVRQRMIFTTAIITALGIEELLRAWDLGDEDHKQQMRDLTPQDMGRFIYFPNKKSNSLTRVAVPEFAGGIAGTINMMILDHLVDKDETNYRFSDYVTTLTTSVPNQWNFFVPMTALFSDNGFKRFGEEVAKTSLSLLPAPLKPLLALANLKTYPSLLPIEASWQLNKLPADRFNEGTSMLAKWVLQQKLPFSRERLGDQIGVSPLKLDALLDAMFGRSIGYITQKPNVWNLTSSVVRDYYFEYGRRLNDYGFDRDKNNQIYTGMKEGTIELTKEEQLEIFTKKELSKEIEKAIKGYSDAYDSKDLNMISETREKVIELIDKYNNGGQSDEIKAYLANPTADNMKWLIEEKVRKEVSDKHPNFFSKEEKKEAMEIGEDFRKQALIGRSQYNFDELLLGLTVNKEKADKIAQVKQSTSNQDEFKKYLAQLRYANLMSDDLAKNLRDDETIDGDMYVWIKALPKNKDF